MGTYFAQPYDIHAKGFYFEDEVSFDKGMKKARNEFGEPVEEFEIQFIDGDDFEGLVFDALSIGQHNICKFIEIYEDWDEEDKIKLICAVGECRYNFDLEKDSPDRLDVDVYPNMTMKELAEHFIDEGLFGDIPERIQRYVDYDAIAADLAMDYTETRIAGQNLIYKGN